MNKREFTVMVDGVAEYSVAFLRDSANWHIYTTIARCFSNSTFCGMKRLVVWLRGQVCNRGLFLSIVSEVLRV